MFGQEATLPVNWIYPDREMELSDWTEVMQERFQRNYAGHERETMCHSMSECSILQTNFVTV